MPIKFGVTDEENQNSSVRHFAAVCVAVVLCARYGAIAASGNSQSTMSELRQKETGVAKQPLFLFGGDEENRTPVRKPIHTTFFVDSLLFKIPADGREQTRFRHW